jgi:DNA transformation protein
MTPLTDSPNIGSTLADLLEEIGIANQEELAELGSTEAIMQLASIDRNRVCLLMLYALEGAVQGIRWHGLSEIRKDELKDFYNTHLSSFM